MPLFSRVSSSFQAVLIALPPRGVEGERRESRIHSALQQERGVSNADNPTGEGSRLCVWLLCSTVSMRALALLHDGIVNFRCPFCYFLGAWDMLLISA